MHGIVERPVVPSLSFLSLFSLPMARLVYAGNSIFSDMVFGAQMMRVPSYRRRFVSLYLTGRQLHRVGASAVIGKCLFVLLLDLSPSPCKVRNLSTYPLSLSLSLFLPLSRYADAAPDLNTIDAFLRRTNPGKPKRVPFRFIAHPHVIAFALKAPFKRIRVEGNYFHRYKIRCTNAR